MGMNTSMPGQEGVASVFSPMARTFPDLLYFTKSFISMKPWEYDHSVHPIPWRSDIYEKTKDQMTLRIGVMESDGVVTPSPACARALRITTTSLSSAGHTIIPLIPPPCATPADALILASSLLNTDGCRTFLSFFRTGEWNDPGAAQLAFYASLPRPVRYLHYLWVKYVRRDVYWAELLREFRERSAYEQWRLVSRREKFRAEWFEWWDGEGVDVILCPPNATPAVPHGGMKDAVSSCGYTFLWNLLDYTAGVLPVTHVDKELDKLPEGFGVGGGMNNGVARGAYRCYDPVGMEGLPVGVQVVGRRLEEEKVLAVMERVVGCLEEGGEGYGLLEIE